MDVNQKKQLELDKKYLRMAKIWAENSHALRRKVGCLIVKNKMIISDGYNGCPAGFENECETVECTLKGNCPEEKSLSNCKDCFDCTLITKPYVLHAEANAITKLAKSGNSSEGATLYVTLSPCLECSKLMVQSGIKRVVYEEEYRVTDGIDLLKRAGIEVVQILNHPEKSFGNGDLIGKIYKTFFAVDERRGFISNCGDYTLDNFLRELDINEKEKAIKLVFELISHTIENDKYFTDPDTSWNHKYFSLHDSVARELEKQYTNGGNNTYFYPFITKERNEFNHTDLMDLVYIFMVNFYPTLETVTCRKK